MLLDWRDRGWRFFWVGQLQGVHGCCKVCCILRIDHPHVGTNLPRRSDVSLWRPFPRSIIDVALEPGLTSLEPGLSPALQIRCSVPLPTLASSRASLVLPTLGSLLALHRVLTVSFVRHRNNGIIRTFKNYVENNRSRLA